MSSHGHKGCFQNTCTNTDKFQAADPGVCARLCSELDECTHWSYGEQDDDLRGGALMMKCFLRKSDEGREGAAGWLSGACMGISWKPNRIHMSKDPFKKIGNL